MSERTQQTRAILFAIYLLLVPWDSRPMFALSCLAPSERYASWLSQRGSNYDRSTFIGHDNNVAIHWKIDGETLRLAVAAEANGWVAFGISEAGGMPGSDVVKFTAHNKKLVDCYALAYSAPQEDDCQDWTLVGYVVESGFILFEASRTLVTGDAQDLEVQDDFEISSPAHRVIAAWGDAERMNYHAENRAKGVIRFFGAGDETDTNQQHQAVARMYDEKVGTVDFLAHNFEIPSEETTYGQFCFTLEDLGDYGFPLNSEVHITRGDFIRDPNTDGLVHHLALYGAHDVVDCEYHYLFLYGWVPGAEPFRLPSDVGVLLGGTTGFKSFRLEVHYDNPKQIAGKVDNSGVRLTYTSILRQYSAGVIRVGDPATLLAGQGVGGGTTRHDFSCPGSCTETHFSQSVTVFREFLHMHEAGRRMINRLIRNGEEVRRSNIDFYDFNQQGFNDAVREPFQLVPGDEFMTSCYYKDSDNRTFGLGSQDEMCMSFMWYYPSMDTFHGFCGYGLSETSPECTGTYNKTTLVGDDDMDRSFGLPSQSCDVQDGFFSSGSTPDISASRSSDTSVSVRAAIPECEEDGDDSSSTSGAYFIATKCARVLLIFSIGLTILGVTLAV